MTNIPAEAIEAAAKQIHHDLGCTITAARTYAARALTAALQKDLESREPATKERWLSDLRHAAEAFRITMVESGALDCVSQKTYFKELRALETALAPLNYLNPPQDKEASMGAALRFHAHLSVLAADSRYSNEFIGP